MKYSALLAPAVFLSISNASPLIAGRATLGLIRDQCTNVRIDGGWLIGECLTGSGGTRITSGTFISSKISNEDGILTWKTDGFYGAYCYECKLTDNGSSLFCQCQPNSGQWKDSTINLDEHIRVYSGHILSDLKGPARVPSSPSKYPFPNDRTYGMGGNGTCANADGNVDWCKSVANKCSNTASNDFGELLVQQIGPISDCYNPNIYFPDHLAFDKFKAGSREGAWEITGYSDEACTQKITTISPEEMGQCKTIGEGQAVKGVTARPLFNGDPY